MFDVGEYKTKEFEKGIITKVKQRVVMRKAKLIVNREKYVDFAYI